MLRINKLKIDTVLRVLYGCFFPQLVTEISFLVAPPHKVRIYNDYHSVCPSGEGLRESQFRRLEKKLSTLSTLCSAPLCILHGLSYSPSWIMYVIDGLFFSTVTSSEGLCEMLILMKKLIEKETGVYVVFKSFVRKCFMSHLPSLY
jgi:hypothetical protein